MRTISVIVGDGDPTSVNRTVHDLMLKKDLNIVGATTDGLELIRDIRLKQPDIVLTGIMLRRIDGFGVLDAIRHMKGEPPKAMILSSVNRDYIVMKAIVMGASYYMLKPAAPGQIYSRILLLAEENWSEEYTDVPDVNTYVERDAKMHDAVSRTLIKMGFAPKNKGYYYLVDTMLASLNPHSLGANLSKEIYPEIAYKHGTSVSCVERAIRTSIQAAWNSGGMNSYAAQTGAWHIVEKRPTISDLIAFLHGEIDSRATV